MNTTQPQPDMINHPPHYTQGDVECIDAIAAALGPAGFQAYCRGQIIKYSWRIEHKGAARQDLGKIGWYTDRALAARKEENRMEIRSAEDSEFTTIYTAQLCEALGEPQGGLSWGGLLEAVRELRIKANALALAGERSGCRQRKERPSVLVARMVFNGQRAIEAIQGEGVTFSPKGDVAREITRAQAIISHLAQQVRPCR